MRCEMSPAKHARTWARLLLASGLGLMSATSALAQNNNKPTNPNKPKDNPVKQHRQDVADELATAVAARIQIDRQFNTFVQSVKAHDEAVKKFVKDKKDKKGGGK